MEEDGTYMSFLHAAEHGSPDGKYHQPIVGIDITFVFHLAHSVSIDMLSFATKAFPHIVITLSLPYERLT